MCTNPGIKVRCVLHPGRLPPGRLRHKFPWALGRAVGAALVPS